MPLSRFTRKKRRQGQPLRKPKRTNPLSFQAAAATARQQQDNFWLKRPDALRLETFNELDAKAVNEYLQQRWSKEFVVENPKPPKGTHEYWKNDRDTLVLRYVETLVGAMPEMLVQIAHEFGRSYSADEVDTAFINGHWYLRVWWD